MNTYASTTHNYVEHQQPPVEGATNINMESIGDSVQYTCRWVDCFNNGLVLSRCDRTFNFAEELMSHIRSLHFSGNACRWADCCKNGLVLSWCDRRFNFAEELMSHIRSAHFPGIDCNCRKCEETKSQKGKTFGFKYVQFQLLINLTNVAYLQLK